MGATGSGDGQFNSPRGVAVDSSGNVYVTDQLNHRIQKFDSNGTFITKWGSNFSFPRGVAVDSSGNVYVVDSENHRIQKFDSSGNFLLKWGSRGSGDGQFNFPFPVGVAVDSSGNVYVTDQINDRIQKFDSSGTFITKWVSNFSLPSGVAVDSSGNVYVVDINNNRIQKFSFSVPVANDDAAKVAAGGTVSVLVGGANSVLANDTDAVGDFLTVNSISVSVPNHGSLILAADGTFTYTHDGAGSITDSFVYEISHGEFTATATVSITIPIVFIPDSGLEGAIRDNLGIPTADLTLSDMGSLTGLFPANKNITDLTGLETAHNLKFLVLFFNQISDLSPLSGLTKLEFLILNGNQISDISPLMGLSNLEALNVSGNFLLLNAGSSALAVIESLQNGGTSVIFEPQNLDIFQGQPIDGFVGWRASQWYLNYNVDFWPWIYHDEHGWQFVSENSSEDIILLFDLGYHRLGDPTGLHLKGLDAALLVIREALDLDDGLVPQVEP